MHHLRGCRHLEFRKNVNNFGLDIDLCTTFGVTSSNEYRKHIKCVDLRAFTDQFTGLYSLV